MMLITCTGNSLGRQSRVTLTISLLWARLIIYDFRSLMLLLLFLRVSYICGVLSMRSWWSTLLLATRRWFDHRLRYFALLYLGEALGGLVHALRFRHDLNVLCVRTRGSSCSHIDRLALLRRHLLAAVSSISWWRCVLLFEKVAVVGIISRISARLWVSLLATTWVGPLLGWAWRPIIVRASHSSLGLGLS